jgi:DNA invertase Pin-like site-specific DNA recombinase
MGKLMLTVLAAFGELERELIRERQREGNRIAKAKGVYKGRRGVGLSADGRASRIGSKRNAKGRVGAKATESAERWSMNCEMARGVVVS